MGSNEIISDNTGAPHEFHLTLPFGETMAEQRKPVADYYNSWKFTGKELDEETGLYYFGARYYQPSWSVWLSVDPKAAQMPEWSPYSFCFDNPILFVDPDGQYPIVTITKQKTGKTTLQRVIGYTGSNKTQYTRVPLYKVTVTDTEDKNYKMSFSVTRDAFAVKKGDAKNGTMTMSNVAFEPKDGNINHYTGKVMEYPSGDGTKAIKLTQYGSEVMHAEANDASVELGYRTKSDVATGVMIHVGGFMNTLMGQRLVLLLRAVLVLLMEQVQVQIHPMIIQMMY